MQLGQTDDLIRDADARIRQAINRVASRVPTLDDIAAAIARIPPRSYKATARSYQVGDDVGHTYYSIDPIEPEPVMGAGGEPHGKASEPCAKFSGAGYGPRGRPNRCDICGYYFTEHDQVKRTEHTANEMDEDAKRAELERQYAEGTTVCDLFQPAHKAASAPCERCGFYEHRHSHIKRTEHTPDATETCRSDDDAD
jgi:predicted Zn-ribbon and HTH transcriptional regulator